MNKLPGVMFVLLLCYMGPSIAADEDTSKSTDTAGNAVVTKQAKPSKPAARKAFRQRQHAKHTTHPNRAAILNNRRINRAGE